MIRITILTILFSISVSQILLICFYLLIQKKGSGLNKLLIGMQLIVWGTFMAGSFLLMTMAKNILISDIGHLMNLSIFLVTPLLYIHFKSLSEPQYKFGKKEFVHTIPFIIIFIYLFIQIVIQRKLAYVFYPTAIYLISFLFLQNIFYFYLLNKKLGDFSESVKDKSRVRLFKFLLLSTLILFSLKLIIFIVWNILKYVDICIFLTAIFFFIVLIILNSFLIFSLNNPNLLLGAFKYEASLLTKEEMDNYMNTINSFLKSERIFIDPLISLERLSKSVKIPEKIISQVINQSEGLNFNDLINRYRIEFAQQMIREEKFDKVIEVAYECGFNSKTTFNSAFKKFTGLTPTEFKKDLLKQELK